MDDIARAPTADLLERRRCVRRVLNKVIDDCDVAEPTATRGRPRHRPLRHTRQGFNIIY